MSLLSNLQVAVTTLHYMKPQLQVKTFLLLPNFNIPTQQKEESYLKVVTPYGGNALLLNVIYVRGDLDGSTVHLNINTIQKEILP